MQDSSQGALGNGSHLALVFATPSAMARTKQTKRGKKNVLDSADDLPLQHSSMKRSRCEQDEVIKFTNCRILRNGALVDEDLWVRFLLAYSPGDAQ